MNKLQKYLKLVLQKLGTLHLPSPSGLGFQVKKLVATNWKVGKKFFFHILAWAFFTRTTLLYNICLFVMLATNLVSGIGLSKSLQGNMSIDCCSFYIWGQILANSPLICQRML